MIRLRRSLAKAAVVLALAVPVVVAAPAFAGGTVTVPQKNLTEANGGWRVNMTVKLPKKPTVPHQTMRFLFTPLVIYETYLDDSSPDEKTRKIPQDKGVQPIVETLDVGFADARNEVWDTTKFDFTIRRDRGFEAGEYQVEVRDADDHVLGSKFQLTLGGKNNVVDRRAMVMSGNTKKKDPPKDNAAAAPASSGGSSDSGSSGGDATPAPADSSTPGDGAAPPPPADKPKGCGCEAPGHAPEGGGAAILGLAALAGTIVSRRRRSPSERSS